MKTSSDNNVRFIKADELKRHYSVYGHFYQLNLNEGGVHKCRSVLEIVSKGSSLCEESIGTYAPNAIVIMMNPGSSKPKEGDDGNVFTEDTIGSKDFIIDIQRNLVKTKPDPTQYQIMRLMSYYECDHVRVINLSDLREPDSKEFALILQMLSSLEIDSHTIFSHLRSNELKKKMTCKPNIPVICAWGTMNCLIPLAGKAREYLDGYPIIGVLKDKNNFLFGHARPRLKTAQQKWLKEIVQLIDA